MVVKWQKNVKSLKFLLAWEDEEVEGTEQQEASLINMRLSYSM